MLAVEAASPYTGPLIVVSLVLGVLFLGVGLIVALLVDLPMAKHANARLRSTDPAVSTTPSPAPGGKTETKSYGLAKDVKEGAVAVAGLFKSVNDQTVATRLLMIGVFLILMAAVTAGADAVG